MRKLLIKLFYGDTIKTARIILPLSILLGIGIAISDPVWNTFTISITLAIILVALSSLSLSFFPPSREELNDKQKELYDRFKR